MRREHGTAIKFAAFAAVMTVMTAALFAVFGEYQGRSTDGYRAVFNDVSDLQSGDSVRVAGVKVGTVRRVVLQSDNTALVDFDTDEKIRLTTGSKAVIRYLNLVGDRYLELVDTPESTRILPAGALIPVERTVPALDLDVLLNGLKPVVQGLNPQDVNALTTSIIEIMQGQAGTAESLMSRTASFTNALADNGEVLEQVIDNLNAAMSTVADDGDKFAGAVDRLQRLIAELATEREPIGSAIDSLSKGTASLVDLMAEVRPPLAATVDQLNRLAPALDAQKELLDASLQRAPENYRKLSRIGSYGAFFNYYLCGINIRVTDLQSRTAVFPWIKQDTGRCAENP